MSTARPATVAYLHDHGEISGGETSLLVLWEHLDRSLFRPVLLGVAEGPFIEAARRLGVECRAVEYPRFRALAGSEGRRRLRALRRTASGLGPALLHGNTPRTNLAASTLRHRGGPAVVWHQRTLPRDEDWDVEPRLAWLADRIICNSAAVARRFGARRRNVVVIHNGVPTERFRPGAGGAALRAEIGVDDGDVAVGIVGNFSPIKNHELFIAAAARLAHHHPDAVFLVVGGEVFAENREREATLRGLVASQGLADRVRFLGPRADMPAVMDALDLLVAASSVEACSRAVLEALAAATPVVAAEAGGNPELVAAGVTGLLFRPDDAPGLAAALEALIVDPERRATMAAAARRRAVEEFTIERQVEAIETVYDAVLGAR